MNDLKTIDRKNADAILRNIPDLLARGNYCVVEFSGVSAIGCESFSGEGARGRAIAKMEELGSRGDSTHGELHEPASDHVSEIRQRDNGGGSSCSATADHLAQRLGIAA